MAERIAVTRIDFAIAQDIVVVNKIAETGTRAIVVESSEKKDNELDEMLAWCESNGWVVRRYAPLGARAWKGAAPRPVRTSGQIRRKRDELMKYPVPGLNVSALNLAYDC